MKQAGSILRGVFVPACALALVVSTPGVASAACSNEGLRASQGATGLPGCMALELVSPPAKFSQPALSPSFSRDGQRLLMKIRAELAGTPGYQYFGGDAYVASRGAGGWVAAPTAPADVAIVFGGSKAGNPSTFTPDLDRWTQFGSTQAQAQVGVARLYGGGLDGGFGPLSPLLVPIDEVNELQGIVHFLEVDGSSADLQVNILRGRLTTTAYLPEDPRNSTGSGAGADPNSYVAGLHKGGEPFLELLARDKDGAIFGGRCGAHLGGENAMFNQGAVSPDGVQIFFTSRPAQPWNPGAEIEPPCSISNPLRVLQRTAAPEGPVISEIAPGGPVAPGDDIFQAASVDATKVYLTTSRNLTASDTDAAAEPCTAVLGASKGCDLYLYDSTKSPGAQMTQASVAEGGDSADVLSSITAVSGDGSRAYFVAQGVLTSDQNPEGAIAQAGQPNLYLYEAATDSTSFLGTLAAADQGSLQGGLWGTVGSFLGDAYAVPLHGPGGAGGGDGHVLAFASKAPLTADDTDGDGRDVFRYDAAAETLERVSKAAPGGADNGPFDAMVNPVTSKVIESNFGEATRWVSESGQVIAFSTAEPLVPGDEDEAINPYIWDAGQLGATFAEVTESPAVAPFAGQVAFYTTAALLPRDVDTAADVYVAREEGGFPEPPPPDPPCDPLKEGGCRGASPAPLPISLATGATTGGNVKASKRCRKGLVKRGGRCVKNPGRHRSGRGTGHRRGRSR